MAIVSALFFFAITFLLAAIAVVAAWMVMRKSSTEHTEEVLRENAALADEMTLLRTDQFSTITPWEQLLRQFDFADTLQTLIAQADLDWSVGRLTSMMLLAATVVTALVWNIRFVPFWIALIAGAAAGFVPYSYVLRKRTQRFRKFQEALPDALDAIARCLRAGYPFAVAMDMIAAESSGVVAGELRRTVAEASLGMAWAQALENLGRRIPLLEVNLFASAVQLHARTGGRLSEAMGQLAETMRETSAFQGEVRALAAHGRLTGIVLTLLPILIASIMLVVNPAYMQTLFEHPVGQNLIVAAAVCLVLAHIVIQKIVDIRI